MIAAKMIHNSGNLEMIDESRKITELVLKVLFFLKWDYFKVK